MRKITCMAFAMVAALCLTSCEGCVKKMAKKATELSISAVEGVSEAISERGEEAAEKATDALGGIAKGAGKSIDRQLNEHAEYVASVAERTLVQTIEGLDVGVTKEYYDEIPYTSNFAEGVSLDYFGRIKSKAVIDAYLIILEAGTYDAKFEFVGANGVLMTKEAEIVSSGKREYSVVSFAMNDDESSEFAESKEVKVTVKKK